MTKAWIALGSNLGKRQLALRAAIERLGRLALTRVEAVATFRETEPVDAPAGSPRFINSVARVETGLGPEQLLRELLRIERELGRERGKAGNEERNAPRVIDLDLLLWSDARVKGEGEGELELPHPRMHMRRFVLEPMVELDPEVVHPVLGRTMRELLETLEAK